MLGSRPSGDWWLHDHMRNDRGLLLDFGGVFTTDFFASLGAHCKRLGLPRDRFRNLVTVDPAGRELYHQMERGELGQPEFEQGIARLLGVEPRGLVRGLLADLRPDPLMAEAVVQARAAGIRVSVISNSWGTVPFDPYGGYRLDQQFDAVVISSDVGIRHADPVNTIQELERLFGLTLRRGDLDHVAQVDD